MTPRQITRWTDGQSTGAGSTTLMVRVTAAAGDPAQMRILGDEAAALTQAGRDRFAA